MNFGCVGAKNADGANAGTVMMRLLRSSFWKMDCAAETMRAPPRDWKTVRAVIISEENKGGWE
jgi:hypothetical protein